MKAKEFTLNKESKNLETVKKNVINFINTLNNQESYAIIIRTAKTSKTLEQLGALFGVWLKYISERTGEDYQSIHRRLKLDLLTSIYLNEPKGVDQEVWKELHYYYQETQQQEKLEINYNRISLKWCTKEQMQLYMERILEYQISIDEPLPAPNKRRKYFCQ